MAQSHEERRENARRYYYENRDSIRARQREYMRRKRAEDPGYERRLRWQLKLDVIAAYGGRCACCGETEPEFLCLDHIDGGGNADRRENRWKGRQFYDQLRRDGYPKGKFRLLCCNCNSSRGFYCYCPHESTERRPEARPRWSAAKSNHGQVPGPTEGPREKKTE